MTTLDEARPNLEVAVAEINELSMELRDVKSQIEDLQRRKAAIIAARKAKEHKFLEDIRGASQTELTDITSLIQTKLPRELRDIIYGYVSSYTEPRGVSRFKRTRTTECLPRTSLRFPSQVELFDEWLGSDLVNESAARELRSAYFANNVFDLHLCTGDMTVENGYSGAAYALVDDGKPDDSVFYDSIRCPNEGSAGRLMEQLRIFIHEENQQNSPKFCMSSASHQDNMEDLFNSLRLYKENIRLQLTFRVEEPPRSLHTSEFSRRTHEVSNRLDDLRKHIARLDWQGPTPVIETYHRSHLSKEEMIANEKAYEEEFAWQEPERCYGW